jgi:hypothetical protein
MEEPRPVALIAHDALNIDGARLHELLVAEGWTPPREAGDLVVIDALVVELYEAALAVVDHLPRPLDARAQRLDRALVKLATRDFLCAVDKGAGAV